MSNFRGPSQRHRELSENILDTQQTDRQKEKIDSLRKQIEDERENLAKIRQSQLRRKEFERIRKTHEKEAKERSYGSLNV